MGRLKRAAIRAALKTKARASQIASSAAALVATAVVPVAAEVVIPDAGIDTAGMSTAVATKWGGDATILLLMAVGLMAIGVVWRLFRRAAKGVGN